jgi:4-amino-4-deoxy-L-arabinose transferase-like glycosyltransferase
VLWLAVVTAVALAVRVANIAVNTAGRPLKGDAAYYYWQGRALADKGQYIDVFHSAQYHVTVPSAIHPPGFTSLLGFLSFIGLKGSTSQLYVLAVLGAATVLLIGMIGTRIMGPRAGLIAAGIAAVYPQMWINNGLLMSETLFVFGFTLAAACAYAYRDRSAWGRLLGCSLGLTLATSARPESLLLFALVLVPIVIGRHRSSWRACVTRLAGAAVVPALVFVPWFAYNSGRFSGTVYISNGFGQTLRQSNCVSTYSGKLIGGFDIGCLRTTPPPEPPPGKAPDETVWDASYRKNALAFISAHKGRVPLVVLAREARVWGIWPAHQLNILDNFVERRGSYTLVQWAQWSYWVLAVLALWGVVCWRRWKIPLYPLMAEVGVTAFAAAITFGNTRYRAGAEVAIVLFAAGAVEWVLRAASARRSSSAPTVASSDPAADGRDGPDDRADQVLRST